MATSLGNSRGVVIGARTPVQLSASELVPGPGRVIEGYSYIQNTPAAEWTIHHNLGRRLAPTLMLADDPATPVDTDIEFITDNTLIVRWPEPFAGRAEF